MDGFINSNHGSMNNLTTFTVGESESAEGQNVNNGPNAETSLTLSEETDEDLNQIFYFESDHLAIRGNRDYHAVLQTLALLEAQRIQATEDIDKLLKSQEEALNDPIGFVEKLQCNEDVGLPQAQKVPSLPPINWNEYISDDAATSFLTHKHMTRNKSTNSLDKFLNETQLEAEMTDSQDNSSTASQFEGPNLVRGRLKLESKPQTFNKLWTVEEQKKLEHLLIEFPPEDVEARRWAKIANKLKDRTPQQVQSRVQKYFIKLAKAGLPIPGRMPNLGVHGRKSTLHKHHRFNKFYFGQSTFMTSYEPPVFMADDDDNLSQGGASSADSDIMTLTATADDDILSDEEDIPTELHNTTEYQEFMELKRIRIQQAKEAGLTIHSGFKCDSCSFAPIIGIRWHCIDCPPDVSMDLCSKCRKNCREMAPHKQSHRLEKIERGSTQTAHLDGDYLKFMPGDYNYLDSNYMPAS